MFEKFLDLIFPNVCGFCNRIDKNSLCKNCELTLSKYELNCIKDCRQDKTKYFDYLFCALKYENIVRYKLIAYKFSEKSYLYKTFTKIITKNKKIYGFMKLYDIIIPVPMYKNKESVRGYNQSTLIAQELAKSMQIKCDKRILLKIKDTKVQSTLNKTERLNNIKDVFYVANRERINNKKIILVDDIYTTGNTVNECSKMLKQSMAKEILVITIAKD